VIIRDDADGIGSATVPVALAGVPPGSRTINSPSPLSEHPQAAEVFAGTPKEPPSTARKNALCTKFLWTYVSHYANIAMKVGPKNLRNAKRSMKRSMKRSSPI